MELLRNPADPGYPVEYLLSRIKGRRSRLIRDWRPLLFDPARLDSQPARKTGGIQNDSASDAVWRNLMGEYQWVHGQMNQQLRGIFSPYFLYAELRTIFICLRRHVDKKAGAIDELLGRSLLSDELRDVLMLSPDLPSAVSGIERHFSAFSIRFQGLKEELEAGGLRGVEQRLLGTTLAVTIGSRLHKLMKTYFSRLIDARNILAAYKCLSLELAGTPSIVPGGSIPETTLRNIIAKDDLLALVPLVNLHSGISVDRPDATAIEVALYRGMTRWLKKEGRDPFGVAPILDYLWRCSVEAMNLSVLYHTRDLEREAAAMELVQ